MNEVAMTAALCGPAFQDQDASDLRNVEQIAKIVNIRVLIGYQLLLLLLL